MFGVNNSASKRRPSHSNRKQSFRALVDRAKPGLAIDTSFSRHRGQPPQQIYPYESKTQELSFVSADDLRGPMKDKKLVSKQHLVDRLALRPVIQRAASDNALRHIDGTTHHSRPTIGRSRTEAALPAVSDQSPQLRVAPMPMHKRIKGLRPSPLDFTQDVSPADRAITIALAIPSIASPDHKRYMNSSARSQIAQCGQEIDTPTIVITPAKEDFDLTQSSEIAQRASGYRPPSSVYSRYTTCVPKPSDHTRTPPVPPLPLFAGDRNHDHTKARAISNEQAVPVQARDNVLSVCTIFEEDNPPSHQSSLRASQSHLPTPRRSKGWWNVITSPFSASFGDKSSSNFWRSLSASSGHVDEDETKAILEDVSEMGLAPSRSGLVFANRASGDQELRSAQPLGTKAVRPPIPRRSDTAPGALGATTEDAVNIYWIPSQGLAAAYYDVGRHFPSLLFEESLEKDVDDLDGWSPSHSVFHPEILSSDVTPAHAVKDSEQRDSNSAHDLKASDGTSQSKEVSEDASGEERTFSSSEAPPTAAKNAMFSTPSEDELRDTASLRPPNDRSNTAATTDSVFSPLTATPIVEDAHVATFMGPYSSNGESREIELTPIHNPTPPISKEQGTEDSDAAHIGDGKVPAAKSMGGAQHQRLPSHFHTRSDSSGSYGLGICSGENEKSLFPAQSHVQEKPRLRIDRFGEPAIREAQDCQPTVPWYRRLHWPLLTAAACLLSLLVVLLVMFVPQGHRDLPVQAQWLNLTGFPSMPTGITTVVPTSSRVVDGCVRPQSLWSCGVPADSQAVYSESGSSQPEFRIEIRFRNRTLPVNATTIARRSYSGAARAGSLVKRSLANSLYVANPPSPSKDDQSFVGNTTDGVSTPFAGDETPFYVSILDAAVLTVSDLRKRQEIYPYPTTSTSSNMSTSSSNASTSAPSTVPQPAMQESGKPAFAELYPFAQAQPLRLYNRGQDDEHYGFYTYFDRSIYVSKASNGSGVGFTSNVPLANASAVCTWSQTRYHVQIWTRKAAVASLNASSTLGSVPAANSSANDMNGIGSFPYPVTLTLDRHGGDATVKGLYCYGLGEGQQVVESSRTWVSEDRAFGGLLINPATVPQAGNSSSTLTRRRSSSDGQEYGGVDGGSGGCSCEWQNWQ